MTTEVAALRHDSGVLWSALVNEPGTGVWVVTRKADVLYANDEAARFIRPNAKGSDFVKTNWASITASRESIAEVLADLEFVVSRKRAIIRRSIWRGAQHFTIFRPVEYSPKEERCVLVTTRRVAAQDASKYLTQDILEIRYAALIDLGELSVLTSKEVEVLAHLGLGYTIEESAKVLGRSPETIKSHRRGIAEKLGTSDRVELARLAMRAGLRPEDALLRRMPVPKTPAAGPASGSSSTSTSASTSTSTSAPAPARTSTKAPRPPRSSTSR